MMRSPVLGPRQVVYEDKYQQIYRVTADFGDFQKEYFVRDSGRRAGVVVVRDESVLLVRQYRLLIDRLSWEIPGGKVDEGESLESAATRECLEETGIACSDLKPLISFHPGLDTVHNPTSIFYCKNHVQQSVVAFNPQEVIAHEWVPLSRCVEMIFAQQAIVDSFSIVGLLSYLTLVGKH